MSLLFVGAEDRRVTEPGLMWAGGGGLLLGLWLLLIAGQVTMLCAVLFAIPLLLLAVYDKASAVVWTFVFLVLLGDIRRIVAEVGAPSTFDPLLLVAPAVTMVLVTPFLLRLRMREPLSKLMLALTAVMGLEIVNPRQGGPGIGISGAFFYMVPIMWFWIGRRLGSPVLLQRVLYRVILPLGASAGIMGLCQNFIGFLPYQQAWIHSVGRVYTSLFVGSSVRAFGFSVSAAEYATLLEYSIAIAMAAFFTGRRVWILLVPIGVTALLLSGGRGLMIKLVVVLSVLWVVRGGKKLSTARVVGMVFLGAMSVAGLSIVAGQFAAPTEQESRSSSAAGDALAHQLGGLAHPFDERYSSAGLHSNMVFAGLTQGFTNPLGNGLGSTTFAAQKFGGGSDAGSSELDFSDMFISLGLIGGSLYIGVAMFGLRAALRYVREMPSPIGLPVLAVLMSTLGGWLIEGQYSTCCIVFFMLGSIVYRESGCDACVEDGQRSIASNAFHFELLDMA